MMSVCVCVCVCVCKFMRHLMYLMANADATLVIGPTFLQVGGQPLLLVPVLLVAKP